VESEFGMPVDLEMYRELFSTGGVRKENKFFSKYSIKEAISESADPDAFHEALDEIEKRYAAMEVADFAYPGT
ncbi:MAG: hypothetical protein LBQ36_00800, partial [Synergistaceae bacterium]|nr:hypothetical protein [Synergistaceae bacterium]